MGLSALASSRPDWFGFVSPDLIRIAAISIPFQLITLIGLNILLAVGKVREFNLLDLAGQSFVLINAVVALADSQARTRNTRHSEHVRRASCKPCSRSVARDFSKKASRNRNGEPTSALLRRMIAYGLKFHVSILAGAIMHSR